MPQQKKGKDDANNASTIGSQRELARRLGWTRSALRDRLIDPTCPIPPRGPWPEWVVGKMQAWVDARSTMRAISDDPLLSGADSPALERYRQARADLAEIEVAQRRRVLLVADDMQHGLARMAAILRQAGQTLQRRYGPDAMAVLTDALDDVEREIEAYFGSDHEVANNGIQHRSEA